MKMVLFSGISGSHLYQNRSVDLVQEAQDLLERISAVYYGHYSATAVFRLKDGAGLQGRFKIHRLVSLCSLGHHRAGGNGTAFSADGEDPKSVPAFKAKHAAFEFSAERSVQRGCSPDSERCSSVWNALRYNGCKSPDGA